MANLFEMVCEWGERLIRNLRKYKICAINVRQITEFYTQVKDILVKCLWNLGGTEIGRKLKSEKCILLIEAERLRSWNKHANMYTLNPNYVVFLIFEMCLKRRGFFKAYLSRIECFKQLT